MNERERMHQASQLHNDIEHSERVLNRYREEKMGLMGGTVGFEIGATLAASKSVAATILLGLLGAGSLGLAWLMQKGEKRAKSSIQSYKEQLERL